MPWDTSRGASSTYSPQQRVRTQGQAGGRADELGGGAQWAATPPDPAWEQPGAAGAAS